MGLFFNDPEPIVIYPPPSGGGFDGFILKIAIVGVVAAILIPSITKNSDPNSDSNSDSSYSDSVAPPENYDPQTVKLSDLDFFATSTNVGGFSKKSVTDNIGNPHPNALVNYNGSGDYNQYYIKDYYEFSGTVFLTDKAKSLDDELIVEFLGDGNSLARFGMIAGVLPQDFLIDVTGVEVLEIRCDRTNQLYGYYDHVGIDATLKKPDPQPEEENPPENAEGEESPENDNHEAE